FIYFLILYSDYVYCYLILNVERHCVFKLISNQLKLYGLSTLLEFTFSLLLVSIIASLLYAHWVPIFCRLLIIALKNINLLFYYATFHTHSSQAMLCILLISVRCKFQKLFSIFSILSGNFLIVPSPTIFWSRLIVAPFNQETLLVDLLFDVGTLLNIGIITTGRLALLLWYTITTCHCIITGCLNYAQINWSHTDLNRDIFFFHFELHHKSLKFADVLVLFIVTISLTNLELFIIKLVFDLCLSTVQLYTVAFFGSHEADATPSNDQSKKFYRYMECGTIFPHKRIHNTTWISLDHTTENQIDHICINKKFRRSMEN
ncbi:craniofacial development 2-like, partial [Schistosoma japonicum]